MTKGEALTIIAATPEDDLGDILMQLAATYWLEETGSEDETKFLFEETLKESHGG